MLFRSPAAHTEPLPPAVDNTVSVMGCQACWGTGHTTSECLFTTCYRCGELGHWAESCQKI